jgi:GT2 family glycosyltransferase
MASAPVASAVVISHNEGARLRQTVDALLETTDGSLEVIVVDDVSTDGSATFLAEPAYREVALIQQQARAGISVARNLGAARAGADVVVFSDAHVVPNPGWLEPLLDALDDDSVAAAAPTVSALGNESSKGYGFIWADPSLGMVWCHERPSGVQPVAFLCGCFIAAKRSVFEGCGRFDEGLVNWGFEDSELCLRLWNSGYRCVVQPASEIAHLFRPRFPYAVDWETTTHNQLRTALLHLSRDRCLDVLAHARTKPQFDQAVAHLVDTDLSARRELCTSLRRRGDDFVFEEFQMPAW